MISHSISYFNMSSKIASSEWAVFNLIEHSLIDDNFDRKDGHPGAADIILLMPVLLVKNLAIWVNFFPWQFFFSGNIGEVHGFVK